MDLALAGLEALHQAMHTPAGRGALTGLLSAAAVDYAAFRSWDDWQDFTSYSWGLASWRWLQGAVVGAVGALGLEALL